MEQQLTVEQGLALEAITIECCIICHASHYVPEMSECMKCGYVCIKCDCSCQIYSDSELAAA
jgi:hypothetical protein